MFWCHLMTSSSAEEMSEVMFLFFHTSNLKEFILLHDNLMWETFLSSHNFIIVFFSPDNQYFPISMFISRWYLEADNVGLPYWQYNLWIHTVYLQINEQQEETLLLFVSLTFKPIKNKQNLKMKVWYFFQLIFSSLQERHTDFKCNNKAHRYLVAVRDVSHTYTLLSQEARTRLLHLHASLFRVQRNESSTCLS